MTTTDAAPERTPYDREEVCEPKLWLDNDPVNNGSNNWGKVDFDLGADYTVIAGLRVTPDSPAAESATIEFAANPDLVFIRSLTGTTVRIVDSAESAHGIDTLEAKIAQATRAIDQTSDPDDDPEARLADTLASLFHWAKHHGLDLDLVDECAERIYIAELAEWRARADDKEDTP